MVSGAPWAVPVPWCPRHATHRARRVRRAIGWKAAAGAW